MANRLKASKAPKIPKIPKIPKEQKQPIKYSLFIRCLIIPYFILYFILYFIPYFVLFFCVFCGLNTVVYADVAPSTQVVANQEHSEHVVWNKEPISFIVPLNTERMITFPEPVTLHNMDPTLTTDKVSILNNAGTLYIKAKKTFDPIRISVVLKQSGEVILIDLSAAPNADDSPVDVVLASDQTQQLQETTQNAQSASINYPLLMRYAIQQLYSPERLVEENNNIYRTPMYTTKSVDLVMGAKVIAMPLYSWRGGDLYVTAILLKNLLSRHVHLNPMSLNGNWLAAAYYPTNYLAAKGTAHDRTTLFLISNRPFNEALNSMREYR